MAKSSTPPGCARDGASALAALAIIAGLLGILRRPNRKGGKQ